MSASSSIDGTGVFTPNIPEFRATITGRGVLIGRLVSLRIATLYAVPIAGWAFVVQAIDPRLGASDSTLSAGVPWKPTSSSGTAGRQAQKLHVQFDYLETHSVLVCASRGRTMPSREGVVFESKLEEGLS